MHRLLCYTKTTRFDTDYIGAARMKQEVLAILKQNKGTFVSGQAISERLDVTRAAIWKCIKQLRQDGYGIESVPNHGYKLVADADTLTYEEVKNALKTQIFGNKIVHFTAIDSTNNWAKKLAEQGEPEGTVVVAEMQDGGRGCSGRQWTCQSHLGIWMSVILRPQLDMPSVPLITQMACAAVGQALEPVASAVQVGWPHDIVLNGKKIGGVLTESSGEIDQVQYVVVGIGININQTAADFPSALIDKATSLKLETGREQSRQLLFCAILEKLEQLYLFFKSSKNFDSALAYCKAHSTTLGHPVLFLKDGTRHSGLALDLDTHGGLVIQLENGEIQRLLSGSSLTLLG